ncbi:MAG: T9SS type A sorting domain-containing protein [Lewinellaceae bacterium]|nr:T9SS type A sorting domain-containing protein [Lewinellaceae bacterium]
MYLTLFTSADNNPLAETALNVFPNPTADVVSLKVKFEEPTDATITIADINGRVVRTENRAAMLDETVTYQMPQLASGTYLARIATEKGTRTLKFVVQK